MKKTLSLFFAVLFLLLCLVPSSGVLLWGESEAGANEVLSPKPKFLQRNGEVNPDFPEDCSDYFNDRFALRQEFITLWAQLNVKLFRTSTAQDVILGRDGWLYYAPTLDDYTGNNPMTEREIFCAARSLSLLQSYAESIGAEFLFAVAPNKNSLYAENMPDYTVQNSESNAARLASELAEQGVNYADLFAAFSAENDVLYFSTDSHWNSRGAALAADALLSSLGRTSGYFSGEFTAVGNSHKGDLYEMLFPAGQSAETDYLPDEPLSYEVTSNSDNPDSITLSTQGRGEGNLLCYRDSFGRTLFPYLAEGFSEAVFSRKNDYSPVDLEKGDTLIIELVERNLRYLNTYSPTFPAPLSEIGFAGAFPVSEGAVCRLSVQDSSLDGYVKVTGIFEGLLPKGRDLVYIVSNGKTYEATPSPDGFCAFVPGSAEDFSADVFFCNPYESMDTPPVHPLLINN